MNNKLLILILILLFDPSLQHEHDITSLDQHVSWNQNECLKSQKEIDQCFDDFDNVMRDRHTKNMVSCCHYAYLRRCLEPAILVCGRNLTEEMSTINSLVPECSTYRYRSVTCILYFYWLYLLLVLMAILIVALVFDCVMFEGTHLTPLYFYRKDTNTLSKKTESIDMEEKEKQIENEQTKNIVSNA